jgi:hypothetical protein
MDSMEKRASKRIPNKELPPFFKSFNLEIGANKNIKATTIDASTSGISFTIPATVKNIKVWEPVTMNSGDGRFKFFGNVVYVRNNPQSRRLSRIGVKFT